MTVSFIYKSIFYENKYTITNNHINSTSMFFYYDNYPLKYSCHNLYKNEPQILLEYLYEKPKGILDIYELPSHETNTNCSQN